MSDHEYRPIRELLLGLAAFVVSVASLCPLYWGFFILGDYSHRDTDPFPDFLRGAVFVCIVILVFGAFAIGPFWPASPWWLALAASAPYLLSGLITCDALSIAIWFGAGSGVFMVFYAITRLCRGLTKVRN